MRYVIYLLILVYEVQCIPRNKNSVSVKGNVSNIDKCTNVLPEDLKEEIAEYQDIVNEILQYVIEGDFKGKTYDELAKFVDMFGPRPAGSEVLEDSIDYMIKLTNTQKLYDVVTEEVTVPQWKRGKEKIVMYEPRHKIIPVLGLGGSICTPPEGITAEVVVVKSFKDLENLKKHDVLGKILVFNSKFTAYDETVVYRYDAASRAAEKGAVAALIRSITPFSINSLHTGMMSYRENITNVPAAAITIEDAELLKRIYDRGVKIVLNIQMQSTRDTKISRNTLVDYKGIQNPEKLVIVSGHIDSWDIGQGAMDDGGGLFISWAVPVILRRLHLLPKRTIRSIFWTAEELGLIGAFAYEERHRNQSDNINFIMESDEGTFAPLGLSVAGNQEARCIIAEILKLFKSINASTLIEDDNPGSDITVIVKNGVPGASFYNANDRYFWYHHSESDTMTVQDSHVMDLGSAFWTAAAYIIADISVDIPR
ncbi:carboxypeptidase Q-like [Amyelois transitella]|uniref:carboxypeptidase Q-like n=1 Tax=Amyelois transitella TaxID=680683 RepID=UPI00298FCB19|nr:carboxypeptidase Q-like [Amyelois transitella]